MQTITGARTAVGQDKITVPAGATKLLGFDATNNAAVVGDPSLTYALIATPTSNGVRDIYWSSTFFHDPTDGIDVVEGTILYVVTVGAATYIARFNGGSAEPQL